MSLKNDFLRFHQNYSREKKYMSRILSEKGAAIIKAVEAGARTGMMGMMWGGQQVQSLIEETAQLSDVLYITVASREGLVLASSNRGLIGTQMSGGLAAGVAHEIRNPLSSIKGIASYYKSKFEDGSEDKEMAGVMIEEVDRLSRVVSELLESELFGHEKGAFTGADKRREGRFKQADKGTIFLDEIGETSAAMQAKLLRVIQERKIKRVGGEETLSVDVRILAATNRNLEDEVKDGKPILNGP